MKNRTLNAALRFHALVSLGPLAMLGIAASTIAAPMETARLEEVVVTARKREENLQDTPVAVTAFTSETIENRGWSNISDINGSVPNLQFSPTASVSGSTSAATIFIRGIGQTDFTLTTEPGVGVFLDGVYMARSVGSVLSVLDVALIEVLRGPQGTLFGKNTIGGAIVVTSQRPADSFEAGLEVTAGRFDRMDVSGSLDIPVSDKLLTKFTVASLNKNGYGDRPLAGDELGGTDEVVGRAAVLYIPTDSLSFSFAFDGSRIRGESAASKLLDVNTNPGAPFLPTLNATLPPDQQYTLENYGTNSIYRTNGTGPNRNDVDVWGAAGTILWEHDLFNAKSITSYRELDSHFGRDGDNSPLLLVHTEDKYDQQQFSQELQINGDTLGGRVSWLLGALYFAEKGNNVNLVPFTGTFGELFGLDDPAFTLQSGGKIDNHSLGVFAQISYDITDTLAVTGGLRYSDEQRKFLPDQYIQEIRSAGLSSQFSEFDPILPYEWVDDSNSRWDPKIGLEYQWSDDLLLYTSYSTGFKGGGFVQRVFPARSETPQFGPETVEAYEAGAKYSGFDDRLRINIAAFHTDYDDLQITVFDGIAPRTVNGGNADIDGFEIEVESVPLIGLTLGLGAGYTNARYGDVSPDATEVTTDSKFPYTPDWTVNSSIAYGYDFERFGLVTLHMEWSYRTSQYLDAANSASLHQGSYSLLDASVVYEPNNANWSLIAGGRNITGTKYLTGGLDSLQAFGYAEGLYAPPAEWFVTARYQF